MKQKHKITCPISTPLRIYAILILVTLISFVAYDFLISECFWRDFSLNVGYGLVASFVVALLTDIGATARQNDTDEKVFRRMNVSLKVKCSELPIDLNTSVHECCGYDIEGEYTFDEWLCRLFDMSELDKGKKEKHLYEIECFLQTIREIEEIAAQQEANIQLQYQNKFFDETYERQIKALRLACKSARLQYKQRNTTGCMNVIAERIVPTISKLFNKEIADAFSCKYSAEKYSE
jgi:hypothetical protein